MTSTDHRPANGFCCLLQRMGATSEGDLPMYVELEYKLQVTFVPTWRFIILPCASAAALFYGWMVYGIFVRIRPSCCRGIRIFSPPPMFSLHIGSCHSYVNCVELWASPVGFLALHCLLPKRVLWVTDLPALFLCAVRSCSKAEYAFVWFLCDTALSLRYFLNTWTLTAMEFFLYMSS